MIILFIAGQLLINYKRGVLFSPFYHYGMYSEVIRPAAEYNVLEVYVDGMQLQTKDFSPQQWDKITLTADRFYNQQKWNSALFREDIHRLLPFADSVYFTNSITEENFNNGYRQQLESITGKKVNAFKIVFTDYTFNGTILNQATPDFFEQPF